MRVSVKELLRNFSALSDKALHEPLIVTKNGRDRLVLVSIDEYNLMRDMIGRAASEGQDAERIDKPKSA